MELVVELLREEGFGGPERKLDEARVVHNVHGLEVLLEVPPQQFVDFFNFLVQFFTKNQKNLKITSK